MRSGCRFEGLAQLRLRPSITSFHRRRTASHADWYKASVVPDRAMDALRIESTRWEQVEKEQVDPPRKELGDLPDEFLQRLTRRLVARRDDLDDRHNAIVAHMPDDHQALLAAVEHQVRLGERGSRQNRGAETAGKLLGQGVRRPAGIH